MSKTSRKPGVIRRAASRVWDGFLNVLSVLVRPLDFILDVFE